MNGAAGAQRRGVTMTCGRLAARPAARLAVPGRRWLAAVVVGFVGFVGFVGCGGGRARPRSLNARCGDGEGSACVRLGVRLEDGGDDLPDPAAAERAFGRACALREMAGCWHQGALLRLRDGDAARRARGLFRRTCRAGAAMGCLYLAEMRRLGEGGRRDLKAAISGYQELCRRGLKVACGDLGVAQQVESATKAQATFRKACTAGDQLACANLGVVLAKSGDLNAALPVLRRACARDEATACVQLAVLVQAGRAGATPDPARAAMLYQRACKAGHEDGCSGLALLLFIGQGVPAKPRTAMRIWRAVCEAGHGPSCANLATAYRSGAKGVIAIDRKAAAAWAAKACGLGVRGACRPASAIPAK